MKPDSAARGRLSQPQFFSGQFQLQAGDVVMGQNFEQSAAALLEGAPVAVVAEAADLFPALVDFSRQTADFGIQVGIAQGCGDLFQFCGGHFVVKEAADAIFAVGFDAADELPESGGECRELRVLRLEFFELLQSVVEFVEAFLIEELPEGLNECFEVLAAIDQGFPVFCAKAFGDILKELFCGGVVLLLFDESGGMAEIFFGKFPQIIFGGGDLGLECMKFCGHSVSASELFFFEGASEFSVEFADAFSGGGDFAMELLIAEWSGEEFQELESERPVFLMSCERGGVGILFFGGAAELQLSRGGCVDKGFELAGAVPCGPDIFAGEVLQKFFFELLDFVVSFEESGADFGSNEWFGDIGESGESSDVVAVEFSESLCLSMPHFNESVEFSEGVVCGGVFGAEFFESGECFVEEFDAVFREGGVELFFEEEYFVAAAGPEAEGVVVAERVGDGGEQADGGEIVVLLSGFAGLLMKFCDAQPEEFGEVCSGGLECLQAGEAVGCLLQQIDVECESEICFGLLHILRLLNGFAPFGHAAAVFGDLCEEFGGGGEIGLAELLFGLFSKTQQFCFDLCFEFAAPGAGREQSAMLELGAFFDFFESGEDICEATAGEGCAERCLKCAELLFGGGKFGTALVAAAAVFIPDPDFASAINAGVDEWRAAAGRGAEPDIIGDGLSLQPIMHDTADRAHAWNGSRGGCVLSCVRSVAGGGEPGSGSVGSGSVGVGWVPSELQCFFEFLCEGGGSGVAICGASGESFEADGFECRWDAAVERSRGCGAGGNDFLKQLIAGFGAERALPGEHFVEDDAKRKQVAAAIQPVAFSPHLFRAHIRRSPCNLRMQSMVFLGDGESEVGEKWSLGAFVEEDVVGFDVAMDDVLGVCEGECTGDGNEDACGFGGGRPFPPDQPAQRASFDIPGHHINASVAEASDVKDGDDVGMIESCERSGFAEVFCGVCRVVETFIDGHFDGHVALEFDVMCQKDAAEFAFPDDTVEAVAAVERFLRDFYEECAGDIGGFKQRCEVLHSCAELFAVPRKTPAEVLDADLSTGDDLGIEFAGREFQKAFGCLQKSRQQLKVVFGRPWLRLFPAVLLVELECCEQFLPGILGLVRCQRQSDEPCSEVRGSSG